jgi:RNA 2',3'-cyclic 3'-phosphodiesterase
MIRCFIALNISQTSRNAIGRLIDDLRTLESGDRFRWVDPNKIHITLKFLGDIREDQVNIIADALDRVSLPKSFPLYFQGVGGFPDPKRARVLWVGVHEETGRVLSQLHTSVERTMIALGFEGDKKRFSPHLTIARIKRPLDGERMRILIKCHDSFKVEEIISEVVFVRSQLTPSGSIYTPLLTVPLIERI